ncbi:MAG: hypothetical protein ACI4JB_06170, partial [Porcipelethomonas sp.]
MIKRLKRRFIIVNMSILTCVLLSVLVSILALMYSSEVKISYELMESIMSQTDFEKRESEETASLSDVVLDVSPMSNYYLLSDNEEYYEFDDYQSFPLDDQDYEEWYEEPPVSPYPQPFPPEDPRLPEEPIHTLPPKTTTLPSPVQTEKKNTDKGDESSDDVDDNSGQSNNSTGKDDNYVSPKTTEVASSVTSSTEKT